MPYDIITILGPTACGKTAFAVQLAKMLNAEIISADSRQVYKRMDIGTGKDLTEYCSETGIVPCHLIDIAEPGTKYNLFAYQTDFLKAFQDIKSRKKQAILCGGSGLYLESVLRGYQLSPVPQNPKLRKELESKSLAELTEILKSHKHLHNTTDVDTAQRAMRAIEIEVFYKENPHQLREFPHLISKTLGLQIDRENRRANISRRLHERLKNGLTEEVESLLQEGIPPEDLIYYGLEYKYVTLYLTKKLTYDEMTRQLEIAIHQFAKRQMTWFRGMEKRGIHIQWINPPASYPLSPETFKEYCKAQNLTFTL